MRLLLEQLEGVRDGRLTAAEAAAMVEVCDITFVDPAAVTSLSGTRIPVTFRPSTNQSNDEAWDNGSAELCEGGDGAKKLMSNLPRLKSQILLTIFSVSKMHTERILRWEDIEEYHAC